MTRAQLVTTVVVVTAIIALSYVALYVTTSRQRPETSNLDSLDAVRLENVSFGIDGMSCMSCVASIKRAVSQIDGVREVDVSLMERRANVKFVKTKTSRELIYESVSKLGYTVQTSDAMSEASLAPVETVNIPIEGMSCESCASSVRRALTAIDGVRGVEVDLVAQRARVAFVPGRTTPEQITETIEKLGFKPGVPTPEDHK